MTIEERLKEYILSQYKSILAFSKVVDVPYTTIDGILKRGVQNSSINNVIKICQALGISTDELAHGRITPSPSPHAVLVKEITMMSAFARENRQDYDVTIDGQPLSDEEWDVLWNSVDVAVGIIQGMRTK